MRVLLDEQLPRQLAPLLSGHEVRTVQQQSWAGLKNGTLLDVAETAGFTVLVTGDRNLQFQQNLGERQLGVVVLCGASNALEDLVPLVPTAIAAIEVVQSGQVLQVGGITSALTCAGRGARATRRGRVQRRTSRLNSWPALTTLQRSGRPMSKPRGLRRSNAEPVGPWPTSPVAWHGTTSAGAQKPNFVGGESSRSL